MANEGKKPGLDILNPTENFLKYSFNKKPIPIKHIKTRGDDKLDEPSSMHLKKIKEIKEKITQISNRKLDFNSS
jgi:hypothetical protein